MDGLAMALNLAYNSIDPINDITRAANLGGDSDSVAAMVGTLTGAIHGLTKDLWDHYIEYTSEHDEFTIPARALKLIRKIEINC
jgi:ADP-ribosylglycohydrolase